MLPAAAQIMKSSNKLSVNTKKSVTKVHTGTRVSVETGSSTGLFSFINLQTF